MENKELTKLAEQLNLTSLDVEQDEYILTKEEEETVIQNEILALKQHASWKMKGLGYSDQRILAKLSETDWEKQIDRPCTLIRANSSKVYDIWQKELREKEKTANEAGNALKRETWTARNIFRLMQWTSETVYGKKLIVDSGTKKLITTICFFLSGDERFVTELGYSFSKGLMIRGTSGLGKTHIPRCVESNELNPIKIISILEIADEVMREGEYNLPSTSAIIYLDDVGSEEPVVNHYGTKINWFKNFIETLYLRSKSYNRIMISTNINFSEIESRYGFRVRSRMKDMFNILDVSGKDMRG